MTVLLTRRGNAAVISARGPMQPGTHATLRGALGFIPVDDHVILDLSDVPEISRAQAEQLTSLLRSRSSTREVVVVAPTDEVRVELLDSGLDRIVPLVRSCEAAIRTLRRSPGAAAGLRK